MYSKTQDPEDGRCRKSAIFIKGTQYEQHSEQAQGVVNNFNFILEAGSKLGLAIQLKWMRMIDPEKQKLYEEIKTNIRQAKTFLKVGPRERLNSTSAIRTGLQLLEWKLFFF